jgi:GT2 family glycosyltransferase
VRLPSGLVNGGRTTFRRKFGLQEGWSGLLLRYATHEDSDFSYRMSRHGLLVVQPDAFFFHADGNDGRYDRFRLGSIRVQNLMALHRESSSSRLRSSLRLTITFLRFAVVYSAIDLARKRLSLPNVRAYVLGAALVPFFMFYPFEDFRSWYHRRQQRLYDRG